MPTPQPYPRHAPLLAAMLALGEAAFQPREWAFLQRLTGWRGSLTNGQSAWLNDIAEQHREGAG
jgi:hypothetical protein